MNTLIREVKTIAVISQYALTRCGLMHYVMSLKDEYKVDIQGECLDDVVDSINRIPVNVLVTDLFGNQETISTQVEALHQFHKAHPLTKVVVYTSVRDSKVLFFLRHILEFSVISRQEPIDDIYDYIRLAVSGEYISSPLIVKLIDELPHSDSFITVNLTRNENEVLSFYLEGMNLTQIARMKNRSIKTVSAQKCSGMRKLGVSNDADLFLFKSKVLTNLRFNY